MTTYQDILDAAQALPSLQRAELIGALWASVSADDWPQPNAEWVSEAQKRSEAFDAGEMTGAPWSEVRKNARRQAGLDG